MAIVIWNISDFMLKIFNSYVLYVANPTTIFSR